MLTCLVCLGVPLQVQLLHTFISCCKLGQRTRVYQAYTGQKAKDGMK